VTRVRRMVRATMAAGALALLVLSGSPSSAAGQGREGGAISGRVMWGTQLSGFSRGSSRIELTTPVGFGVGVSGPLSGERLRIGLDVDVLFVTGVSQVPGPPATNDESSPVLSLSSSVSYLLAARCDRVCAEISATAGFSRHSHGFDQTFDDIILDVDEAGWWPAAGAGLEVWFPKWLPGLSLTVDDRLTWPAERGWLGDRSPIQTLMVGVGWTW